MTDSHTSWAFQSWDRRFRHFNLLSQQNRANAWNAQRTALVAHWPISSWDSKCLFWDSKWPFWDSKFWSISHIRLTFISFNVCYRPTPFIVMMVGTANGLLGQQTASKPVRVVFRQLQRTRSIEMAKHHPAVMDAAVIICGTGVPFIKFRVGWKGSTTSTTKM